MALRRQALKNFDAAIKDFDKVIELVPNNFTAYNNRAGVYTELEEYKPAIEDYSKVIALDPKADYAYYNCGNCYQARSDATKAKADFDKARKLGFNG